MNWVPVHTIMQLTDMKDVFFVCLFSFLHSHTEMPGKKEVAQDSQEISPEPKTPPKQTATPEEATHPKEEEEENQGSASDSILFICWPSVTDCVWQITHCS